MTNLRYLKDKQLLIQTKKLSQDEREIITKMLHHLKEVERRRLFCDLRYGSLFEYAVNELKYSEGQACRRIRAMRLIKEIPQVEKHISSGKLSLSNVSQATSFFLEKNKENPNKPMTKSEKIEVLDKLSNKSSRQGKKELLKLQPEVKLPKERERQVTETDIEVRFTMDEKVKENIDAIRSLLGASGASMSFKELIKTMSELALKNLKEIKFGKNALKKIKQDISKEKEILPTTSPVEKITYGRYISKAKKQNIWQKSNGKCTNCGSNQFLQIDHIMPVALGGNSAEGNLRLLCFNCNQRAAIKDFGIKTIEERVKNQLIPMGDGTRNKMSGSSGARNLVFVERRLLPGEVGDSFGTLETPT